MLLLFSCCSLIVFSQPLSPRTANYVMDISLDVENKMIYGETILEWNNPSDEVVPDLQFHLYYNAFKNSKSTFYKDGVSFDLFGDKFADECTWAFSEILSIVDESGNDLISDSRYIAPDDGNEFDQTVLLVPLMDAVKGQGSAKYVIKWKAKIPKVSVRTGYNQDFYFFAQWFPKLGVYEPAGMRYSKEGAWNCHQYHASGEYYGEFGNYDVKLTVPENYVVGASGNLISTKITNGQATYRFKVEDVIDFTWTCSPHYVKLDQLWRDVNIQLYTYPGHEHFAERYFTIASQSFEYMDKHVGNYPYSTLSIIDPPIHGLFTGGMEYPTLISSISSCLAPAGVKMPHTLVVHEFVHQYFMQMVSTHEQEEPWMDEGITTYYEGRILDEYYGEKTSLIDTWGAQLGNGEYNRYEYWNSDNPKVADNSYKARDFKHGGYSAIAYNKTAMMLKTLEGILGLEEMDRLMMKYFETWKFRHPCGNDFIAIFKENISEDLLKQKKLDLDRFFEQALYGSLACDYSIASVSNLRLPNDKGFLEGIEDCIVQGDKNTDSLYHSKVVFNRLGEMILPIEVHISYEDGSSTNYTWDGEDRSSEFANVGTHKIVKVELDPYRKLNLEKNFIDNSYSTYITKGHKKYTSKLKLGLQHFLDFLSFLS